MNSHPLKGKTALVTGAAGGIGSAICRHLAEAGAQVIVTYRSSEADARALLESLAGGGHLLARVEVDDSSSLQAAAQLVGARYGALDLLVNNAGVTRPVPHDDLEGLDDALIDEIFRVNVRGALAAVRAMKPLLESVRRRRRHQHLVGGGAHGRGQQRGLLRLQGRARLGDALSSARPGPRDSRAVRGPRLGLRRVRAPHGTRGHRRASQKNAAGPPRDRRRRRQSSRRGCHDAHLLDGLRCSGGRG